MSIMLFATGLHLQHRSRISMGSSRADDGDR